MNILFLRKSAAFAFSLVSVVLAGAPLTSAQTSTTPADDSSLGQIVGAIQKLEGKSDAKCHASATRLENFMYGTPLTDQGREAKQELQKKLIVDVWKAASADPAATGKSELTPDDLAPWIGRVLTYRKNAAGDIEVRFEDKTIQLTSRDIRQYSSIAYALRAILAVQQDALLSSDVKLVPMSTDAIAAMKELVDVYTLSALQISDRQARTLNQPQIDVSLLTGAWKQLGAHTAEAGLVIPTGAPVVPGEVLRKIVQQKLESFKMYNGAVDPLFFSNIKAYYVRHPWPDDDVEIAAISRNFSGVVMDLVGDWIIDSQRRALAAGRPVVREKDVREAFEASLPFEVNQYEDVTFFSNLPRSKQVSLEAYDCDSFRDSGIHWLLVRQVIDSPDFPLRVDFDPFAAELLAEGTAQAGVLIFRVAGLIAKEAGAPALRSGDILSAEKRITALIKENFAAPPPARKSVKLASSSEAISEPVSGRYFDDVTKSSGIDFMHRASDWLSRFQRSFLYSLDAPSAPQPGKDAAHDSPPSFSGSGVASEDVDGDGRIDVLIVGGLGNRLYLNNGDGTFRDGTAAAGINWLGADGKPGEPRQPLIVDFDNDGRQDLFISYVNAPHRLYRNIGNGRFEDVTARSNLGGDGLVGSAATAFDFDRDGKLDLYICYYGDYVKGVGPNLARKNFNGSPNKLFRNVGNMKFVDVSAGSGVENTGWSQACAAVDLDNDGWQDLVVGNDFGVNSYYRNLGNGKFEDIASRLGTDIPSSSMNIGTADLNADGFPEVYISNILTMVKDEKYVLPTEQTRMKLNPKKLATMRVVQNNHLFMSVAKAGKLDHYELSDAVDREDVSTGWAWNATFFDFDNDGDDDLYVVNGLNEYHMYDPQFDIPAEGGKQTWIFSVHEKEPNVFFVNQGGKLQNRSKESGADFSGNSRAATYFDFDSDGDLDVLVNNYNMPAVLLRNNSERLHHNWLRIRLQGDPAQGSNRDAVGARLDVVLPNGKHVWREVQGGTGYLSMNPKAQMIGLGTEKEADVTVYWPDGNREVFRHLRANEEHRLGERSTAPSQKQSPAGR